MATEPDHKLRTRENGLSYTSTTSIDIGTSSITIFIIRAGAEPSEPDTHAYPYESRGAEERPQILGQFS